MVTKLTMLELIRDNPYVRRFGPSALSVLVTFAVAFVVMRLIRSGRRRLQTRLAARPCSDDAMVEEQRQRVDTVLRVGDDVLRVVVLVFAVLTALGQLGVSVQPLVAGAGLVAAAVALGSQTVVKDFVAGFFIVLEGHFTLGDTVVLAPTLTGVVERMTLRVTILRDADGSVHIVPNGAIVAVTNRTYLWSRSVATFVIDPGASPTAVREALAKASAAVKARDTEKLLLEEVLVAGPSDIKAGGGVEWSMAVKARPGEAQRVKSWMLEEALSALREASVTLKA